MAETTDLHVIDGPAGAGHDGWLVVRPRGDLDAGTADGLRRAIGRSVPVARLGVDLAHVTFVDSTGLGVLVGILRKVKVDGGVAVIGCPRPGLRRVLQMTRIDELVPVGGMLEQAMGAAALV